MKGAKNGSQHGGSTPSSPSRSRPTKSPRPPPPPSPSQWDSVLPFPSLPLPLLLPLVFLAAILPFISSHQAGFVFDDSEAITSNQDLEPTTPLLEIFENDFWGNKLVSNTSHKSYRPLTVLTFRLNYYLAGGRKPWGYHVTNILLHGVVSCLSVLLFSVLLSGRLFDHAGHLILSAPRSALLAALLFAVHPIHTESVAGVVGRADLLCAMTFILAFLCYVKSCYTGSYDELGRPVGTRWGWLVVSIILCLTSVLFKEQGITVLGICSAFDIIMICRVDLLELVRNVLISSNTITVKTSPKPSPTHRSPSHRLHQNNNYTKDPGSWWRSLARRHVMLATAGVVILVGRWRVMGSATPVFQKVDNPHSFLPSFFLRVINYNYLYALNGWLLLNPWWLCFDWSMGCIPPIDTLLDIRLTAVIAFWSATIALLLQCLRGSQQHEKRILTLSVAMLVVPFLPATNLFFRVGFVVAERVLYLPCAGFVLIVVIGLRRLTAAYGRKLIIRLVFIYLLTVFTVRSIQRTGEWRTEKDLFESGMSVCPLNAKVHYNIAKIYGDSGSVDYAIEKYKHAIRLHPEYDQAMNNLANILKERGQLVEAETLLLQATSIRPEFAAAWMNLGIVQAALSKNESAEHSYRMALKHRHKYPDCFYNLGNLYLDEERYNEALSAWRNATILKPTHVSAWSNMILLLDNLGRVSELEIVAREAQSYLPHDASIQYNIANAFGKANKYAQSEVHFIKALELSPNNPSYHSNLGVLYHRWGKLEKAKESYERALILDPHSDSTKDNLSMLLRKLNRNR